MTMTIHRTSLLLRASAVLLIAAPTVMTAQTRVREAATDSAAGIPRGMMPPAGKCRVWMNGVPATRQPAPTDCATAMRKRPANARVIYGPSTPEQRQAGLDAARNGRRPLLTPIGQRQPVLQQENAARATPPSPASVSPTTRTRPTVRATPPSDPPARKPEATKVPPKKPERP